MGNRIKQLALAVYLLIGLLPISVASTSAISPRIVGGTQTSISAAPSTVALINTSLLSQTGSYYQSQFCGGTVIDSRWVLTAAHCVFGNDGIIVSSDSLSVLMGSTDLVNPVNQPVGITRIIVHENYSASNISNDIALLRLEYDALVPSTPIDAQAIEFNEIAFIAGWGALQSGSDGVQQTFPRNLQSAFVYMLPGLECSDRFLDYRDLVDGSQLCAGSSEGQIDTCQGDSGGPLYRLLETGTSVASIAGITSFGIGCGNADTPGVYTRVAAFGSWIQSRTGGVVESNSTDTEISDIGQESTPQVAEATAESEESPLALKSASGAGGSGWMLPLMAIMLWLRKRLSDLSGSKPNIELTYKACVQQLAINSYSTALILALIGVTGMSFWGQQSQANEHSGTAVSLATQPIGQDRDTVFQLAQSLWRSEPVCTVVRTGYGMSRRAYFLETCTFNHSGTTTVAGAVPETVEYRFLENKLVQVSFEFDEILNQDAYRKNTEQQAQRLQKTLQLSIEIDSDFRATVSDAEAVAQIHMMRKKS